MTSYCRNHSEQSVRRTLPLVRATQHAILSGLTLIILLALFCDPAAAQTHGSGSFSISGTERWYCPPSGGAATNQATPNSVCTGQIYDAGTVTIIVNGWSTNTSYSQSCTNSCVALNLKNALNVSASPVTATVSGSTVTMTAKATGSQSNYAVTSSASTSLPTYFTGTSFSISPASFSLTGGTDILPPAPTGIAATPTANGLSVALSWIDNATNENNYRVERCTGASCSTFGVLTSTLAPNTTTYTDPTTAPSTTYRYRVQATNTAGGSAYSTTGDVSTPSVPAAPTNFNATPSADGRSATVTWTDNATTETGYSGNYCPGGTPGNCTTWQNVGTYPANTMSYTKTGLSPGTTNMFEVHAYNAVGDSTHVGNVNVTQPDYPGVSSITSATSGVDGTTATITWGDVATETAYYLERCTGTSCTTNFVVIGNNLPANTTSFPDSGLTSGTTYGYRVRAYNAVGYSAYSTVSYLTPSAAPPAAPTGLTATSASNGQSVTLNWTDNASNEISYQLQRCTGTGCTPSNYQSLAANTTSKIDSPTIPSTLYGYVVCAVNAGGNSCSSTVYVTASSGVATVHYYISDHLGSASLVVNGSSGAVEEEEMYYPYGGERWTSGTDPNHYKFSGKERDSETGLDYFGARYYGSKMGRWMSPDWAERPTDVPYAEFGNPQSLNLYGYVVNNPLANADPDGHCCWEEIKSSAVFLGQELVGVGKQLVNTGTSTLNGLARSGTPVWAGAGPGANDPLLTHSAPQIPQLTPSNLGEATGMGVTLGATIVAPFAKTPAAASTPEVPPTSPEVPTSIPAGPSARPTAAQQSAINEMGEAHGCSTCGAPSPGTKSGNWVGDHQPPTALNSGGGPQVYKPQCLQCSRSQGGQVAAQVRAAARAAAEAAARKTQNGQ